MVGNPIVVKMIESTIEKTIHEIKVNPQKGAKSLIDLAKRFASSPVQKDLAKTLQTMLKNPNSPYHKIFSDLVNNVNHHTLKTFILNMAYNSCSYGGKKIKQYKKAYNFNIPWTIIFDFTAKTGTRLNNDMILHIIEQGNKLGIYTYMFFTDNINDFAEIQKRNPDCAFILHVPPTILTAKNICMINSYHNTFFSVLYEPTINTKSFKDATKLLYENQSLFGSYGYYNNESTEYILSNKWINEIVATQSLFGFLIESQDCSPQNASLIHNYIYNSKTNQEHPVLLIDLYEDICQIDNQLSRNPQILKIMGNGDINLDPSNTMEKLNISTVTLLKVLST